MRCKQMSEYVIFTDSACDILPDTLKEWGVRFAELTVQFKGSEQTYQNYELDYHQFYERMRSGEVAVTSAVNSDSFVHAFEPALKEGLDIFYLGFSTGLSATYQAACIAADELRSSYPDRKILTVDSLSASAGYGLLLYFCVQKKQAGYSIEEVAKYAEDTRLKLCHWFTVDDLVYLKRGGRVSAATALLGGMLGIKPVLHVDDEGHLINMSKARGRKNSIRAMADAYGKTNLGDKTIFISHGDCREDAEYLAEILKEEYNASVKLITYVGPVIGAHSGPGTLALFFLGSER